MQVRLRVVPLEPALEVGALLSRLRSRRGLVALDSRAGEPCAWSLVLFDPLENVATPDSIPGLRSALARLELDRGDEVPGPFQGGFVGALSYDLGVSGEAPRRGADDPWHSPLAVGGLYVDFVVRDERRQLAWLVLGEGALDGRAPLAQRRAEILSLLSATELERDEPGALGPLVRHTSADEHRRRIEALRAEIAAGTVYQANLAYRTTRAMRGDALDLYLRLRRENPAPYMAYLQWDERLAARGARFPCGALLSASPELFFEFDGTTARTRPIKGTAPRDPDAATDRSNAEGLLASAKDRAELAMIVDLERNDLGRVARVGSVEVERFPHLESYASVHHLTADVTAEIAPGHDAVDVLAALFPGGSITGAPKLAAMDAIARLEGEGRGFFTGALGFIDLRGRAAWNILIRTLVWRPRAEGGGDVSFHVGGGITWSSDAAVEERETLAKAAALVAALGGSRREAGGAARADSAPGGGGSP